MITLKAKSMTLSAKKELVRDFCGSIRNASTRNTLLLKVLPTAIEECEFRDKISLYEDVANGLITHHLTELSLVLSGKSEELTPDQVASLCDTIYINYLPTAVENVAKTCITHVLNQEYPCSNLFVLVKCTNPDFKSTNMNDVLYYTIAQNKTTRKCKIKPISSDHMWLTTAANVVVNKGLCTISTQNSTYVFRNVL